MDKNLKLFFFLQFKTDTPVILEQGQGHQTWNEFLDPKHGYKDAKFEKPHLNSVCEKAHDKVFVKSGKK